MVKRKKIHKHSVEQKIATVEVKSKLNWQLIIAALGALLAIVTFYYNFIYKEIKANVRLDIQHESETVNFQIYKINAEINNLGNVPISVIDISSYIDSINPEQPTIELKDKNKKQKIVDGQVKAGDIKVVSTNVFFDIGFLETSKQAEKYYSVKVGPRMSVGILITGKDNERWSAVIPLKFELADGKITKFIQDFNAVPFARNFTDVPVVQNMPE